jgi:phosphoribosylformimino-5-aminoimidazole carboxamide ribotide isomerase
MEKKMTFSIIPAIDIRGGNCVRLQQGEFAKETIFSELPEKIADKWVSQGAKKIHIVDLDGANSGRQKNDLVVKKIVKKYGDKVSIQVGGGIRDMQTIEKILDQGASFVVIGTAAVNNPGLVKEACAAFLGHIIVAIDAKKWKSSY